MDRIPAHIDTTLAQLAAADGLRTLRLPVPGRVDFTSNDYLGLARAAAPAAGDHAEGAGGSRLLSGHHPVHAELEGLCAEIFQGEAALCFGAGYMANLALLSALPTRHDTVVYDERCHASIKDGVRLSFAQGISFRHNDLGHLEEILGRAKGEVYVVTEALFSMDGDVPDLAAMAELVARQGAWLIVDEAHSTGVFGAEGEGLVAALGLTGQVLARVHTFGKAVGRQGAAIVGPGRLKDYLVNRARPFIYTTAVADAQAASIAGALKAMRGMGAERQQLATARGLLAQALGVAAAGTGGPIFPYGVPGNAAVRRVAAMLQEKGYDVRAILAPTVPAGTERLRIVLHSFNTEEEIAGLGRALRTISGAQG